MPVRSQKENYQHHMMSPNYFMYTTFEQKCTLSVQILHYLCQTRFVWEVLCEGTSDEKLCKMLLQQQDSMHTFQAYCSSKRITQAQRENTDQKSCMPSNCVPTVASCTILLHHKHQLQSSILQHKLHMKNFQQLTACCKSSQQQTTTSTTTKTFMNLDNLHKRISM